MLLNAKHICKSYAGKNILDHVDLELQSGQVLGLLGENGAGKSTTMQIISGCLAADDGDIEIDGINLLEQPEAYRKQLGFLPEHPPVFADMHVNDYVTYAAKLRSIEKTDIKPHVDLAIERCNLESVLKKRIKHLSKGYQQRVGIAQAIVHQPKLVILDEPTVGLDPIQLEETRALIRTLAETSGVILSTHILQEVESCCDKVTLIKQGKVALHDSLSNIDSLHEVFLNTPC